MNERPRILVVDDNEAGRYTLAHCLRRAGHEVVEAATAQECFDRVADFECDLVVLDVKLPDLSGIEVCRRLKANALTATIPVVQISALFTSTPDRVAGLESGADAYLTAPFEPREVLAYVSALLRARQAESALRQSNQFNRSLVDSSPDCIEVLNLEGVLLSINPAGQTLRQVSKVENYLNRDWASFWSEADRARIQQALAVARQGGTGRLQAFCPSEAGKAKWWDVIISPIHDARGKIHRLLAVSRDITERKRVEAALHTERQLLETVVNHMPASVNLIRGSDLRLQLVNPSYAAIAPGKEMVGKTLDELWPETGRSFSALCRRVLQTGESHHVQDEFYMIRRHPGQAPEPAYFSWSLHRVPLPGDEGWGILNTAWETTERKLAEEALRRSEERLRLAQAAGQIGIHDFNPRTGELHWDERVRELWGIGPNDPVNYEVFMSGVHPEDRAATEAAIQRALDPKGDGRLFVEYRLMRGSTVRWIAATGRATFEQGKAVRLTGTVQDISQRKEFQAELERLVAERTAKLHELVAELEHFSYSITHDMRAPLRAMRGFAEIIRDLSAENPQPELRTLLDRMIGAAERMDILITDALNYSKAVRQELPLAPIDLGSLLRGMLDTYPQFLLHRSHIRVEDKFPRVMGNEAALIQCFSNLIGNALKFVEPGKSPDVRIRSETLLSPERAAPSNVDWVRLWVVDKGIGISPAMLPRVFNMFARGTGSYEGTGIGLALVQKVVQRMGGRVGVESEEGKGSRFYIDLRPA